MKSLYTLKVFLIIFAMMASERGFAQDAAAAAPVSDTVPGDSGITKCNPAKSGDAKIVSCMSATKSKPTFFGEADIGLELTPCLDKAGYGTSTCFAGCSPIFQKMTAYMNMATTALQKTTSIENKCKSMNENLEGVNNMLGLYNAACGTAQGICTASCSSSIGNLNGSIAVAEAVTKEVAGYAQEPLTFTTSCNTAISKIPKGTAFTTSTSACNLSGGATAQVAAQSVAAALKTRITLLKSAVEHATNCDGACSGFSSNLAAAALMVYQNNRIEEAAKACRKELEAGKYDCAKTPTDSRCPINCSLPDFASNKICICEKNPRTAGCDPNADASSGSSMSPLGVGSGSGSGGGVYGTSLKLGGGGSQKASTGGTGAEASLGAGVAGGGVGGVSSGRGSNLESTKPAGATAGYNTSISGGDGGGGGGGRGGRGGGYADTSEGSGSASNKVGNKTDSRSMASGIPIDIATSSGSSNFDRIRQSYQQKTSSFIGGGQ